MKFIFLAPTFALCHALSLAQMDSLRHSATDSFVVDTILVSGNERTKDYVILGESVSYDAFCDAVAACLRDRLIREPIRLPEGALQCHWHLELTPAGVAAARQVLTNQPLD